MLVSSLSGPRPAVSIILPTYNRAKFLSEAFESICSQRWTDWELIVVDDGSMDNSRELIAELAREFPQKVFYIYQDNQGAYGARNTGLDHARGRYIAFYDSDDLWLAHHLKDCCDALDENPDVDWVWGACRIINHADGNEISPHTFYVNEQPRPFMRLKARPRGRLIAINDGRAACCQIEHGLYCGLQNSVIRSALFAEWRFNADLRNEAEDQVVVIWALVNGFRFGYLNDVHVCYRIHETNSSFASSHASNEKRRNVQKAVIAGFERLMSRCHLPRHEMIALHRRLASEYFWHLGYSTYWLSGDKSQALASFRKGMRHWPWDWRYWKTYASVWIRRGTSDRQCNTLAQ